MTPRVSTDRLTQGLRPAQRLVRSHTPWNSASSDSRQPPVTRAHHCLVDQVAEGATIAVALRQRHPDYLVCDQFLRGVDLEGRAPGAGPIEIADPAGTAKPSRKPWPIAGVGPMRK
jgi:hypothetical protein